MVNGRARRNARQSSKRWRPFAPSSRWNSAQDFQWHVEAASTEGSDDRHDSVKTDAQGGPGAQAFGILRRSSDRVSLNHAIETSPTASGTDSTHKRRRDLEAASEKAKIRRAAITERERIDLESNID